MSKNKYYSTKRIDERNAKYRLIHAEDFVKLILKLYSDKTTLKGVPGQEEYYLQSKKLLNSCYGMCATNIYRPITRENDTYIVYLIGMQNE